MQRAPRRGAILGSVLIGTSFLIATAAACGASTSSEKQEHRIRLAREYRNAVKNGDIARVRGMQSENARVWFDKKEGEGRPLNAAGKGPWAQWDSLFQARSTQSDYVVQDDAVRFTNLETNDWYLLVERVSLPYHIFYFFDDADRISGKLVQAIPGQERPPDRLDEFRAWAEHKYPGLMDELMPEGRIDPSLDKARLWKKRLLEWRVEEGLPNVLDNPE